MYFKETHFCMRVGDVLFSLNGQVIKFEESALEALQMGYKYDHNLLDFQLYLLWSM